MKITQTLAIINPIRKCMFYTQIWFGVVELYLFMLRICVVIVEGGEGFLALNEYLLNSSCQI